MRIETRTTSEAELREWKKETRMLKREGKIKKVKVVKEGEEWVVSWEWA